MDGHLNGTNQSGSTGYLATCAKNFFWKSELESILSSRYSGKEDWPKQTIQPPLHFNPTSQLVLHPVDPMSLGTTSPFSQPLVTEMKSLAATLTKPFDVKTSFLQSRNVDCKNLDEVVSPNITHFALQLLGHTKILRHIDDHRKQSVSTFNKCLSGCRVKHFQTLQALALALKSSGQIKQYIFLPRRNPLCPTLIVHHITSVQQDYAPQDSKLTSVFKCQLLFEHWTLTIIINYYFLTIKFGIPLMPNSESINFFVSNNRVPRP